MAKISVVVPVYKVEPYLRRCVDSILSQTFKDFELILVDDGSPDRCGVICDEYAKRDSRVVVIHQENAGLSAARNAGIDWTWENSASEWLTFIDSDDWIAPNYLEVLYLMAHQYNVEVSAVFPAYVKMDGSIEPSPKYRSGLVGVERYWCKYPLPMVAWGKLYAKRLFSTLRYPEGLVHEDEHVTPLILFDQEKIAVSNHSLYYYRFRPESIVGKGGNLHAKDMAYEKQIAFFTERRFEKARRLAVFRLLASHARQLAWLSEKKDQGEFAARHKLRNLISVHKASLIENEYAYRMAYPDCGRIVYPIARVLGALMRGDLVGAILRRMTSFGNGEK